jgi:peptidoglycan/LPS O-acetylase OafA/YrhL
MVINEAGDLLPVALTLVVSIGLAQLSWTYFESRLVRIGHRYTYNARPEVKMIPAVESARASSL